MNSCDMLHVLRGSATVLCMQSIRYQWNKRMNREMRKKSLNCSMIQVLEAVIQVETVSALLSLFPSTRSRIII